MLISELARATDESPRTLRFYEAAGLVAKPPRTSGNYRDYPDSAVARIGLIRALQSANLSLDHIAVITHILDAATPATSTDTALLEATMVNIDTQLDTLRRIRRALEALAEQIHSCDAHRTSINI